MTGNVRVTLPHGAQYTGRLISLTATEVVVRQKKSVRDTPYLLTDIKIVETMHHNTRNLAIAGGAAGLGISLASDLCGTGRPYGSSGEPACITAKPLLITAGVAAVGALIGGALDRSHQRVLYAAPSKTALIVPVIRPAGAGVRVVVRW